MRETVVDFLSAALIIGAFVIVVSTVVLLLERALIGNIELIRSVSLTIGIAGTAAALGFALRQSLSP